jgi:hypothetical protein
VGLSDIAGALGIGGGASQEPAVRRPVAVVSFAAAGGGGGDLGGLAGAAASAVGAAGLGSAASAAAGALGIGGGGADDPWARCLVSVTVDCGVASSVDSAEIRLAAVEGAPDVSVGDAGTVALGYSDADPQVVFTGEIASVERDVEGATRLVATNGGAALAALRFESSYEQQSAGDVVRDAASRASVDTGTIADGATLPFLAVDGTRSAWRSLAALARANGAIAFFTADAKLAVATAATGDPAQTFTYGVDVLSLEAAQERPGVGAVTAVGDGAAGGHGTDAWSWLVKDSSSVSGSAGTGDPARMAQDGALRTGEAAGSAASGISALAALLDARGRAVVPGAPAVGVGTTIAIGEAPTDELNGSFLVLRVRHTFSKRGGFRSAIEFSKVGAAAGGGAGGLLAAAGSLL